MESWPKKIETIDRLGELMMGKTQSTTSFRLFGWCVVLLLISTQSWGQRACPPSQDFTEGLGSDFGGVGYRWTNCIGTHTLPDGSKYVGEFQFGQFSGHGTYTFPDGSEYIGEFSSNTFDGQGTLTRADGSTLKGLWENGVFQKPQGCSGNYDPATWTDCVGVITLAGGRRYEGEFRDGQPNVQGTYSIAGGERDVGVFKDGAFNGQGTLTRADGSTLKGLWENGEFLGSN